jgi:hypothetical protein
MRFARRGLTVVLTTVFVLAGMARADVFQQVPSDAVMVIRFNNLQQTSQRLGKLARDLGLAAMVPQAADPLAFAKDQLKLSKGINDAGDAAIVVLNPAKAEAGEPVYVLIPVTDYDAFLGNFEGAVADGEFKKIEFGQDGEESFVVRMGNYAAIAPKKENLVKPDGLRLTPVARKESDAKDITVIANFVALRELGLPALKTARGEVIASAMEELEKDEKHKKFAPAVKSLVNQALNIAEAFLRDTDTAVIGLGFAGDGINIGVVSEFQPASYLGQLSSSLKNTDAPLLGGIPAGKYIMYGGVVGDPAPVLKVVDDFSSPVVAELQQLGEDGKSILSFFNSLKALVGEVKGQSFAMYTPTIALGQAPLFQVVYVVDGNGERINAEYRKLADAQDALMTSFGVQPAGMTTTITDNAKTVAGVSFTKYATNIDENAADPEAAQAAQMMKIFYGAEGATVYTGVAGGKFLSVMGLSDEQIEQAVVAVKSGASPLSGNQAVKMVGGQLPQKRLAEFYVHVDELVMTALTAAGQFGMGVNVQLPPDLPPVGATVSSEGSALRIDAFVPTPLVQSLVAAGMQVFMQMQGGGQPGGPGGL